MGELVTIRLRECPADTITTVQFLNTSFPAPQSINYPYTQFAVSFQFRPAPPPPALGLFTFCVGLDMSESFTCRNFLACGEP